MQTPLGAQTGTLNLTTDDETLAGTMTTTFGTIDIEDGKAEGDNLSWTAKMTQPMPMTVEVTATVDGDSISGEAQLGAFGAGPFTGTRT